MSGNQASRYGARLSALGLGEDDLTAWQETGLPDSALDDWLTDRVARRPRGSRARQAYGAEHVHDFARHAILAALDLNPSDHLLEVGCGGGLLLRDALGSGARATGIDHSEDMVLLAHELAPGAQVVLATADALPFAEDVFTAAAMSVVFFFLDDPVRVLRECCRVLRRDARLAVFTTAPELRGTPAAPEPIASRGHFFSDEELADIARRAGLCDASVQNDNGGQLLTARA